MNVCSRGGWVALRERASERNSSKESVVSRVKETEEQNRKTGYVVWVECTQSPRARRM